MDVMNIEYDPIYSSTLVNKSVVYEYFRLVKDHDIDELLLLFTDDAVIYDPFSSISGGLWGKDAIKPFLEIAMMANSGLEYKIVVHGPYTGGDNNNNSANMERCNNDDDEDNISNKITALVTFQRGDSIRARFTFEAVVPVLTEATKTINSLKKKIQRLNIQFIR